MDDAVWQAVASPVTLSECLVIPYRLGDNRLMQLFMRLLVHRAEFVTISQDIAHAAAELRSHNQLNLADAFQVATARSAGCEAFLTNDIALNRLGLMRMIVLDDLTPD